MKNVTNSGLESPLKTSIQLNLFGAQTYQDSYHTSRMLNDAQYDTYWHNLYYFFDFYSSKRFMEVKNYYAL